MKKLIAGVLSAAMAFSCLSLPAEVSEKINMGAVIEASAETYEYGDFNYTWSNGTIEITSYTGKSSSVVIPRTINYGKVSKIGDYAFDDCTSITSITIPDSVTSIGKYAFRNCINLVSITMPNSIVKIDAFAFRGCTNLTDITIPSGVTSIEDNTFYGCKSLSTITIPNRVTNIGNFAFEKCESITNITMPDSVVSIGVAAFSSCKNLTSITIPDSVTKIGASAFSNCENLTKITIPNNVTKIGSHTFQQCKNLANITIPNDVTSIGEGAFYECTSLTSITIPNKVTNIGNLAFEKCESITNITMPDSVVSIGAAAFSSCKNLTSITIPSNVTNIEDYAFNECTKLTNIIIPDDVTSIGKSAFNKCESLTSVTIPNSVTSIGNSAFKECTRLTSITIPGGVTTIKESAFSGCLNLKNITIPDGVTSIENGAFYYCESLTDIYYKGAKEKWGKISIDIDNRCLNNAKIHYNYDPNHTHSYISKIIKQPTCTTTGIRTYTCSCEDTYTETIKATGHTFGSWTTTKRATCTETGTQTRKCSVCGKTETKSIAKLFHTYKTTVVAPTYAAQGYTLHKCSSCGTSYKDKYTAKKTVPTVTAKTTYTYTTNAVRINWNKLSGVTGYKIYRYNPTTKQWTALKAIYDPNVLTYKDSNLKAGTVYKYKVKAFVKSGGKFYFGNSCSSITTATKPATATITKTTKSSTAVRLYWKKVTCSGYKIQRYNATTKKWIDVKTVSSGTTNYRIASLKKNTSYKFRVCAYKNDGKKNLLGAWSYVTVKTSA